MNPITIIVSDGVKSALIIDGKLINGVEEVSFRHKSAEAAEVNVSICNTFLRPSELSEKLLIEAAKVLGYELASK